MSVGKMSEGINLMQLHNFEIFFINLSLYTLERGPQNTEVPKPHDVMIGPACSKLLFNDFQQN